MRTVQFYADRNRSDNLLHIETDGCIINVRVGLTDSPGHATLTELSSNGYYKIGS